MIIQIILHVLIIAIGVNIALKSNHVNVIELSLWILGSFAIGIVISILIFRGIDSESVNPFLLQMSSIAIMYSLLFYIFKLRFRIGDAGVRMKILGVHFIFVIILNIIGLF